MKDDSVLSLKVVDKKMSNRKTGMIVDAGLKPDFKKGALSARLEAAPFQSIAP